jgi:NAD(P)-dependent dehydrogenase (short-subunit alcohol dehydrogenase family)
MSFSLTDTRVQGDINSKDGVQKLAQDVGSQSPNGIHLLVNNAGIARDDNTKYSNGQPDMKVKLPLPTRSLNTSS